MVTGGYMFDPICGVAALTPCLVLYETLHLGDAAKDVVEAAFARRVVSLPELTNAFVTRLDSSKRTSIQNNM